MTNSTPNTNQTASIQPTLILIPDISGFTKFINETEIAHSKLIIVKLLEAILEANEIGLSVSEIGGDAVLFYKLGDAPPLSNIAGQFKTMFLKFHHSLNEFDRERTSECEACGTAKGLTLKIIVHFGKVSTIQIKDYMKLLGTDVILAHRLLKNNLLEKEYILMSKNYLHTRPNEELKAIDWTEVKEGSIDYEHIGLVSYVYVSLSPLHKHVPSLPE